MLLVVPIPGSCSYLAITLIHARNIDLGHELNSRRQVWVFVTAVYVDAVNSVLVGALEKLSARSLTVVISRTNMWRTENGSVPIRHH